MKMVRTVRRSSPFACLLLGWIGCLASFVMAAEDVQKTNPQPPASEKQAEKQAANSSANPSAPVEAKPQPPAKNELATLHAAKIRKRLQETTSFELSELQLPDAVLFLKKKYDLNIVIDQQALGEIGFRPDLTINMTLRNASLEAGLQYMLDAFQLTFIIQDGVILVTTEEKLAKSQQTRVFPVRDLIEFQEEDGKSTFDPDRLIKFITIIVDLNSWSRVGGAGEIEEVRGLLVVRQSEEVLDKIELLLAALRRIPAIHQPVEKPLPLVIPIKGQELPQEKKILAQLEKPVTLNFFETPLGDVVSALQQTTQIDILLDERALDENGLDRETLVTIDVKELPLQFALRQGLRTRDLTFVVRDQVLLITTADVAKADLEIKLYPVRDLLDLNGEDPNHFAWNQLAELGKIVTEIVQPKVWSGREGNCKLFAFTQRAVLGVACPADVHEEIESLLAMLRKKKEAQTVPEDGKVLDEDAMVMVVYGLSYFNPKINEVSGLPESPVPERIDVNKLLPLIPVIVGKELWGDGKNPEVILQAQPDAVLVRHHQRVQRKVEAFMNQLGVMIIAREPELRRGGSFGSGGGVDFSDPLFP